MSQSGILLFVAALAAQSQQMKTEQAERTCLAQALYYEARGEGERGQQAVAEVVLRRVASGKHPKSICGVVHEPHQFSFVEDGSMSRPLDARAWATAKTLAAQIIRGEIVTSLTRRATYYHKTDVRPRWAKSFVRTVQIGHHVFYQAPASKS